MICNGFFKERQAERERAMTMTFAVFCHVFHSVIQTETFLVQGQSRNGFVLIQASLFLKQESFEN